jgi:hypothetical protein
MTRVKLAELTSGIGALVLGVGLGALFADWFASSATAIVLVGGAAHAFGMWDKHQLERQSHIEVSRWVAGMYWTCWLLLAALVVLLIVRS